MPSRKRANTTQILVQVPDSVHTAADARRRRERVPWSKVITTLLDRWAAGDESAVAKVVRISRPRTPDADEADVLHRRWMETDDAYRRAATEKVDITTLTRYGSLAELLAAGAAREGRIVPHDVVAGPAADLGGEHDDE